MMTTHWRYHWPQVWNQFLHKSLTNASSLGVWLLLLLWGIDCRTGKKLWPSRERHADTLTRFLCLPLWNVTTMMMMTRTMKIMTREGWWLWRFQPDGLATSGRGEGGRGSRALQQILQWPMYELPVIIIIIITIIIIIIIIRWCTSEPFYL